MTSWQTDWFLIVFAIILTFVISEAWARRRLRRVQDEVLMLRQLLTAAQTKAVKMDDRSQATYRSKYIASAAEKLAPYFPNFPLLPREVKFLGDPIDFIGFENLADESPTPRPISIVLMEIKTGSSTLGRDQLRIQEAIQARRIRFIEYRPLKENGLE